MHDISSDDPGAVQLPCSLSVKFSRISFLIMCSKNFNRVFFFDSKYASNQNIWKSHLIDKCCLRIVLSGRGSSWLATISFLLEVTFGPLWHIFSRSSLNWLHFLSLLPYFQYLQRTIFITVKNVSPEGRCHEYGVPIIYQSHSSVVIVTTCLSNATRTGKVWWESSLLTLNLAYSYITLIHPERSPNLSNFVTSQYLDGWKLRYTIRWVCAWCHRCWLGIVN